MMEGFHKNFCDCTDYCIAKPGCPLTTARQKAGATYRRRSYLRLLDLLPDGIICRFNQDEYRGVHDNGKWLSYSFQCVTCELVFSRVLNRIDKIQCPNCKPFVSPKLTNSNRLSMVRPDLVEEWHPGNPSISNYAIGSNKRVKWRCSTNSTHEWTATIASRCFHGTNCPYCSGNAVCEDNCLATVRPDIAREWHPDNRLKPTDVTSGSRQTVRWLCNSGHSWRAGIHSRTGRGHGCPYCSGQRMTDNNCLGIQKPSVVSEWHPCNSLTPFDVTVSSSLKVWWICPAGHEYEQIISSHAAGHGCRICAGMHERVMQQVMKINYPDLQGLVERGVSLFGDSEIDLLVDENILSDEDGLLNKSY